MRRTQPLSITTKQNQTNPGILKHVSTHSSTTTSIQAAQKTHASTLYLSKTESNKHRHTKTFVMFYPQIAQKSHTSTALSLSHSESQERRHPKNNQHNQSISIQNAQNSIHSGMFQSRFSLANTPYHSLSTPPKIISDFFI